MTPGVPIAKRFAVIPLAVVIHRMETSDCLDSRFFWAIIRWSWCGVEPSPDGSVVLKDEEGWIRKDAKGRPIPAKQDDIRELLGLAPSMKAAISRAAARLELVGSIRYGKTIPGCKNARIMYPVQEPPTAKAELKVDSTATLKIWHIGTLNVSTDNFKHLDELARTELEAELDDASTWWLRTLKGTRTTANGMVVQAFSRRGILIENSKRSRLAKREDPPPLPPPLPVNGHKPEAVVEEEEPPVQSQGQETQNPSEEPAPKIQAKEPREKPSIPVEDFVALYPSQRIDHAKTTTIWKQMRRAQKEGAIAWLKLNRNCPRWAADDGRWIPFASTFLREEQFLHPPPPAMQRGRPNESTSTDDVLAILRRNREGT
jgi:hypothetical protein